MSLLDRLDLCLTILKPKFELTRSEPNSIAKLLPLLSHPDALMIFTLKAPLMWVSMINA